MVAMFFKQERLKKFLTARIQEFGNLSTMFQSKNKGGEF